MIKELLYKWFGLEDKPCSTCEVLQRELENERREKERLLDRLLMPKVETQPAMEISEMKPLPTSRKFIPHAVRQQMMDQEDRKSLELMQKKQKEIKEMNSTVEKLEEEILGKGEENASKIS
jgi:hypothetical protein